MNCEVTITYYDKIPSYLFERSIKWILEGVLMGDMLGKSTFSTLLIGRGLSKSTSDIFLSLLWALEKTELFYEMRAFIFTWKGSNSYITIKSDLYLEMATPMRWPSIFLHETLLSLFKLVQYIGWTMRFPYVFYCFCNVICNWNCMIKPISAFLPRNRISWWDFAMT